jgi:hypothetical protein
VVADFTHNARLSIRPLFNQPTDKERRDGHQQGEDANYDKLHPHRPGPGFDLRAQLHHRKVTHLFSPLNLLLCNAK